MDITSDSCVDDEGGGERRWEMGESETQTMTGGVNRHGEHTRSLTKDDRYTPSASTMRSLGVRGI